MAYRRYYRRRNYGRRTYGRKRYNRFRAKMRKSIQQRDCNRVILSSKPLYETLTFYQLGNDISPSMQLYTKIIPFSPIGALWFADMAAHVGDNDAERRLPAFVNFAKLYDQFKINAIRLKLSINYVTLAQSNSVLNLRIALDRNGIAQGFAKAFKEQWEASDAEAPGKVAIADATFESYSSFYTKLFNQSDLYAIYKTFMPSGVQQRGKWYGCSYSPPYTTKTTSGTPTVTTWNVDKEALWSPDINMPFKPFYMVQFSGSGWSNAAQVNIQYQWDFDITFKGQRNITNLAASSET